MSDVLAEATEARAIWSPDAAKHWHEARAWPVGANFLPSGAINQLEMWQAATFDADQIDRELGWAQAIGMNTMRVYLHDLLWDQDARGFRSRIDAFLTIAAGRGMRAIFVLFDSCWDPDPVLGPQRPPIPGVHNPGWVQSPGRAALEDPERYPRLRAYVDGVVGAFAGDERILAWDVWNEPDNLNTGSYAAREADRKIERVAGLLGQAFVWARGAGPVQPLTSGLWHGGDWSRADELGAVQAIQLAQSDIISFHDYGWPEGFERRIRQLSAYDRPMICTEFLARGAGSTFDGDLPIAKRLNVGMINWGLVEGRSQTILPWDSWQKPYVMSPPVVWHHDVFHRDGKPYRRREAEMIRAYAEAPKFAVP